MGKTKVVHVGEFFAVNYPSLEGGWTADVDDMAEFMKKLEAEYAAVGTCRQIRCGEFAGEYEVEVYEHETV